MLSIFCYGILTLACAAPESIAVPIAFENQLAGNFAIEAPAETRITFSLTLPDGFTFTEASSPDEVLTGAGGQTLVAVTSDGKAEFTGLKVSGPLDFGDRLVIHARAWNPNAGVTLADEQVVAAEVRGVTDVELITINPAANPTQQTFVRLVNNGVADALVLLRPTDDAGNAGGEVSLMLGAGEAVQLTSDDLENGNALKGLDGAFGDGEGKWRVRLITDRPISGQALVRNANDGTLSALQTF